MRPLSRHDATLAGSREVRPALGVSRARLPRAFTCEGFLGLGRPRGEFVPALEAAARMALTLAEVEGLAAEGWLDWQGRGGDLWVRPVVLSRLRVRDPRVQVDPEPVEPATSTDAPDATVLDDFGRASA